jgi:hypothetical protein
MSGDADGPLVGLIILAAVVANLYAVFYTFRPWYRTPQGRALWVKAWGNTILLDMGLSFQIWGDYPGRHAVRLVGFSIFLVGITYLLISLLTSRGAEDYPPRSWLRRGA